MNYALLFYLITGGTVLLYFSLFAVTSVEERKPRAAWLSATVVVLFGTAWVLIYLLDHRPAVLLACSGLVWGAVLLFLLPFKQGTPIQVQDNDEKVDERDVIFAREEYLPGTEKYDRYYAMRPENREVDDRLRSLPGLLCPGGRYHEPAQAGHVIRLFQLIEGMLDQVDGPLNEKKSANVDPATMTARLKEMILGLGASEVGVARMNPRYLYSHVGRGPEPWGAPIENHHRYALVFTLEMRYEPVESAPLLGITEESATQYLKGAEISIAAARYIRSLGVPARAHIAGSNYQVMLPPLAHDAGLGELGRIGYLISRKYGARVRLGAVTTDLELVPDRPVVFGVQDFCARCLKCAVCCPSGAIPRGEKTWLRGVEKWPLEIEKCLHYWRQAGTDCGLCMKVCPYSHPPTLAHNLVRLGLEGSPLARTFSAWGDDVFYGKRPRLPDFEPAKS